MYKLIAVQQNLAKPQLSINFKKSPEQATAFHSIPCPKEPQDLSPLIDAARDTAIAAVCRNLSAPLLTAAPKHLRGIPTLTAIRIGQCRSQDILQALAEATAAPDHLDCFTRLDLENAAFDFQEFLTLLTRFSRLETLALTHIKITFSESQPQDLPAYPKVTKLTFLPEICPPYEKTSPLWLGRIMHALFPNITEVDRNDRKLYRSPLRKI